MKLSDKVFYAGVNDRKIDLFEGHFKVPDGMAYNSYVIKGEKTAVMDAVEKDFADEWLSKINEALEGRAPDYLVVQHMEPDHSSGILRFAEVYPDARIVSSQKAFTMMKNFFGNDFSERRVTVSEGDTLPLGGPELSFIAAPMVHWPEVMRAFEKSGGILFSADAFGKFGTVCESDVTVEDDWECEARRYYFGIVGKYGAQVRTLLKKIASLDVKMICPLHGPVLDRGLKHYVDLYGIWSSYEPEDKGVTIAYTSVYGNTEKAARYLFERLSQGGAGHVAVYDLARCDVAEAVEDAFRYDRLVLATTTYNTDIFPYMREFIEALTIRGYRGRTVALIENGSWAPCAAKVMKELLSCCKNLTFTETEVKITSAPDSGTYEELDRLAAELLGEGLPRD